MSMKRSLLAAVILLLSVCACQKQGGCYFPPVKYLYAGGQGDNQFQMWIWIYENEAEPALVRSGMCRYIDNQHVDTDEERLACHFTESGFTLADPGTGKVLYTATYVEREGWPKGHIVRISWNHSPGITWDTYAKEKGWLQEMNLQVQICEGDDIVY